MQEKSNYIFIHGLGGLGQSASGWNAVIAHLSPDKEFFTPDLWDLSGKQEITYSHVYRRFVQYCENHKGPLHLCGLSIGGTLALNYAIEHPDRVASLILVGTQYKVPKMMIRLQNVIFGLMPEKSFITTMGLSKKNVLKLTKSMMNLDFTNELKKISCPSLILCGDKDTANLKATNKLSGHIPHAKKAILANAGHEVNVDNPTALANAINKFWD